MERIAAKFEVSEVDSEARTISGVGVPWNEVGYVPPLGRISFAPGSLTAMHRRTPLTLGHDGEPVGVLAEIADTGDAARVLFRVDATPDGDRALVQAASGSRGAFSVGADVVRSRVLADGTTQVQAAEYDHFALLPHGAFASAEVERVQAEQADEPAPATPATDDDDEDPSDEAETTDDDPEQEEEPEVSTEQETLDVEAQAPPIRVTAERRRELTAGEFVRLSIQAQHGDREASQRIEAALAETISTDVPGLLPPTYEKEIIGGKDVPRPLYSTFRGKPLPGVGLAISKPKWTTPPVGAWAATVDADATTSKAVIGSQAADVERWDWAGAFSWVVVQRSDPSLLDEVYGEAIQSFYVGVEAKVYAELAGAAAGVSTSMGAGIAEFWAASGARSPDVILMAPDVWGVYADAGALNVALVQGGVSASGGLSTSFAGIEAVVSGSLAAGEVIMATKRAIDARTTEPVQLTANAIGALNVELAVVGEGLFDTDYPGELLKFAAVVPTIPPLSRGGRGN